MDGRTFSSAKYRYGFNGQEKDDEVKGAGNSIDYGMRIYDPRLGRFLSVDAIGDKFPWYTPYQFAGNTPIQAVDLDGNEPDYIVDKTGKVTAPVIFIMTQILNYDKVTMQAVTVTKLSDPI